MPTKCFYKNMNSSKGVEEIFPAWILQFKTKKIMARLIISTIEKYFRFGLLDANVGQPLRNAVLVKQNIL